MYTETVWATLIADEGTTMSHKGLHAINDGGYHEWMETVHGWKPDEAPTLDLAFARALSESIRKDVECTFGIMKKRHRVLRVPCLLSSKERADAVFKTCGIMHNNIQQ